MVVLATTAICTIIISLSYILGSMTDFLKLRECSAFKRMLVYTAYTSRLLIFLIILLRTDHPPYSFCSLLCPCF